MALAVIRGAEHRRPVFIVGVPRSGTTAVRSLLEASPELDSTRRESHAVWDLFHHPHRQGFESAAIGTGQVRRGERRLVNAYFSGYSRGGRLLDKAPASSLRIPHIRELFPDAMFVAVWRNPPDVISSLIDGWTHPEPRFVSYRLPVELRITGHRYPRDWRFALIPGWRGLVDASVPDIAFAQWERISAALEEARAVARPGCWVDAYLEDLNDDPIGFAARLCEGIGIACGASMRRRASELSRGQRGPHSAEPTARWRQRNGDEIRALLPRIAAAGERGYRVDASTGGFELTREHALAAAPIAPHAKPAV
jgi:hypothetical protein